MDKGLHTPAYRQFAALLREIREEAGITQQELAARIGERQDFVSKCERGVRRLDVVELRRWCLALDASLVGVVEKLEARLSPVDRPRPQSRGKKR